MINRLERIVEPAQRMLEKLETQPELVVIAIYSGHNIDVIKKSHEAGKRDQVMISEEAKRQYEQEAHTVKKIAPLTPCSYDKRGNIIYSGMRAPEEQVHRINYII